MVNAWRNAPIQGGVADIMLASYAELHDRLRAVPSARPVQTVHDSVVVECDRDDADMVVELVRDSLELASLRFCPDVTPKADIDIRTSLADADVIDDRGVTAEAVAVAQGVADIEPPPPIEAPISAGTKDPVQLELGASW